ncbi:MAG: hypothetical protein K1X70_09565 [Leptospirales bacterium]|nr:hypothetical protein [Leptospirales bacterium]
MTDVWKSFFTLSAPAQAAIISSLAGFFAGVVGVSARHLFERFSLRFKLRTEYEYEQRKKMANLLSLYHGRLFQSAEALNHRLWNLQKYEGAGWLRMNGKYHRLKPSLEHRYYFITFVFRFTQFMALVRKFEAEALFIDSRIARRKDTTFVKFAKTLEWCMCDTALFHRLDYNPEYPTDHFFRDQLQVMESSCDHQGQFVNLAEFRDLVRRRKLNSDNLPSLAYFDGLRKGELRLRWDRLVVFHLILITFLNSFGYDIQRTRADQLRFLLASIQHPQIIKNLLAWFPRLGLARTWSVFVLRWEARKFVSGATSHNSR